MARSEVYSWRLSPDTKAALEVAARRERTTIGRLLEKLVHAWLHGQRPGGRDDDVEQARLHAAAKRAIGTIHGGDPRRAEQARLLVRRRVKARRAS